MKINEILKKDQVTEGWSGLAGAALGAAAGSMVGHPIAGSLLGMALAEWLALERENSRKQGRVFKVYMNGHSGADIVTKDEAVKIIMDLAVKEHNRKTEYTIYDTEKKKIVFRQYWSEHTEETESPGWQQVNTENKEVK